MSFFSSSRSSTLLSWQSLNPENPDSDKCSSVQRLLGDPLIIYASRFTFHASVGAMQSGESLLERFTKRETG